MPNGGTQQSQRDKHSRRGDMSRGFAGSIYLMIFFVSFLSIFLSSIFSVCLQSVNFTVNKQSAKLLFAEGPMKSTRQTADFLVVRIQHTCANLWSILNLYRCIKYFVKL